MSENNLKKKNEKIKLNQDYIINKDLEENEFMYGKISVTAILKGEEDIYMQGVKINLYKINGLSPVLIESKTTDKDGNAEFLNIPEGCYRIIEIIDKNFYEKPKYINWNEIIIDKGNKIQKVTIVNKTVNIVK